MTAAATNRVEAFSDGVFAIAITLLILEIKVPAPGDAAGLGAALLARWPSYAAYVISFVSIGIMWANHHTVMDHVHRADRGFQLVTVIFLMAVSFVPYPTAVVAAYINGSSSRDATIATMFLGASYFVMALSFNLLWWYAKRCDLLRDPSHAEARAISARFKLGPWPYLAITLLALVNVTVSLAGLALLAVYWAVAGWGSDERRTR